MREKANAIADGCNRICGYKDLFRVSTSNPPKIEAGQNQMPVQEFLSNDFIAWAFSLKPQETMAALVRITNDEDAETGSREDVNFEFLARFGR